MGGARFGGGEKAKGLGNLIKGDEVGQYKGRGGLRES